MDIEQKRQEIDQALLKIKLVGAIRGDKLYLSVADLPVIYTVLSSQGVEIIDKESIGKIPAETAASSDVYYADGVGSCWERDAPIFKAFYDNNFHKTYPLTEE